LSTHPQWTVSSRDWTHIGTIWTSKADELPGPSTIKFKFKFYNDCRPSEEAGRRREWSLEGRERSRPLQTKIRLAVVGNSQVVRGRDPRTAKCDRGLRHTTLSSSFPKWIDRSLFCWSWHKGQEGIYTITQSPRRIFYTDCCYAMFFDSRCSHYN